MWNGAFSPTVRKHRRNTGDIANHIRISEPEVDEIFGIVRVKVTFTRSPETYDFEFPVDYFPANLDGSPKVNKKTVGNAIETLWLDNGGNLTI